MNKSKLTFKDILPNEYFLRVRKQKQQEVINVKNKRRIEVGPDITFYFENKETIQWQIQEMLRVEPNANIEEELQTYNPLIPDQSSLIATMMIEIPDPIQRLVKLQSYASIEKNIYLHLGDSLISKAHAIDNIDRTRLEDGKTSSVHFLKFIMTKEMKDSIVNLSVDIRLSIKHTNYNYQTIIPKNCQLSLIEDLSLIL